MYVRSLFFLLLLTVEIIEAVVRPMVSFNPDWNKIFTGESINMTCNVDSTGEGDEIYHWFKDSNWIHSGKTFSISSAQKSNSGIYQCQTSRGERSDSVSLEVHNGYVILQVSPHIYEGDNLTLRCHHYPGHPAGQTIFYKNNAIIKGWGPEDEIHIEDIDMTSSTKYKCTKQVNHHLLYYQHTDETSISVQELFSMPTIALSPQSVTEGDPMTLTCHTKLTPLRQNMELEFAFYRDGQTIQEFSLSNKYEIMSVKQQDTGDYKCQVQTSNGRIKKMGTTFTLQVKTNGTNHWIIAVSVTSLVLVLILIVTAVFFLYRARHPQPVNNLQLSKAKVAGSEEPDSETENIYMDVDRNI